MDNAKRKRGGEGERREGKEGGGGSRVSGSHTLTITRVLPFSISTYADIRVTSGRKTVNSASLEASICSFVWSWSETRTVCCPAGILWSVTKFTCGLEIVSKWTPSTATTAHRRKTTPFVSLRAGLEQITPIDNCVGHSCKHGGGYLRGGKVWLGEREDDEVVGGKETQTGLAVVGNLKVGKCHEYIDLGVEV
jgi:hypothetical protein